MGKECRNCGSTVSDQYARVCGGNEDEVYRCPSCAENLGIIRNGGGGKKVVY